MRFQPLLRALYELHSKGSTSFDSQYLAALLQRPVAEVSKDLRRLHWMGFLKRTRLKRECLSKNGKLCYKGYQYEYYLSNQGLKYARWMLQVKPHEDALCLKAISEAAPHVPRELNDLIVSHVTYKESSRYKGSNRLLQALGPYAFALPALTESLREMASRNEELERKCRKLEESLNQANESLNQANEAVIKLFQENLRLRQALDELSFKSCLNNIELLNLMDIQYDLTLGLRILNEVYRRMIMDLGLTLMAKDPDLASKLLPLINVYYMDDLKLAEEFFHMAKQNLQARKLTALNPPSKEV